MPTTSATTSGATGQGSGAGPGRAPPPASARTSTIALAGLGAFLAIGSISLLPAPTGPGWIIGSFGASCVLLFGFPQAPFSRVRNVIGGHVISSTIGLALLHLAGPAWWAMALAVGFATMAMMATDTVHPPAGGNPIIVFLSQPGWEFVLLPTLAGACTLVVISRLYRHLHQRLHRRLQQHLTVRGKPAV